VMNDDLIEELAKFAHVLADAAGKAILPYFRTPLVVDNKAGEQAFDPVTVADKEAEGVIRQLIETHYPDHGIVGEEHGIKESKCGLNWVLDPIDGTRAFIMGLPTWGTLIALNEDGQPLIGIMDQPYVGERFSGTPKGTEVTYRGHTRPLKSRACPSLSEAVIAATHPSMFNTPELMDGYQAVSHQARLSRYGGDCYLYSLIASGCVDLAIEASLETYDVQALIPIIEGAGGRMCTWDGGSAADGGAILAAGDPKLLDEVLEVIANSRPNMESKL